MRIGAHAARGVRDAHQTQELDRAIACFPLGGISVDVHRLGQLLADLVERMKRGQRVLEDHRDLLAPDRLHLLA